MSGAQLHPECGRVIKAFDVSKLNIFHPKVGNEKVRDFLYKSLRDTDLREKVEDTIEGSPFHSIVIAYLRMTNVRDETSKCDGFQELLKSKKRYIGYLLHKTGGLFMEKEFTSVWCALDDVFPLDFGAIPACIQKTSTRVNAMLSVPEVVKSAGSKYINIYSLGKVAVEDNEMA